MDDLARVEIDSAQALRDWLAKHHTQNESVWLVTWKKPDSRHVPWPDVVDELLCYGWIDSQPRKLDDQRSMLRLSPRKPKSAWSAINKAKVDKLIAAGRMTPAGIAIVELAKSTGTWDALAGSDSLVMPDDLVDAFAASKTAYKNFEAFPKSVRRAILEWLNAAKKPETRAARILETVEKAKDNIRANQWRPQREP
jgi:uncharacterized protein YdeI (YjbR/CyaY-like superfamily)